MRGRARSNTVGTVEDAIRMRLASLATSSTAGPSHPPQVQAPRASSQVRPEGTSAWPTVPVRPPPTAPTRRSTTPAPHLPGHQRPDRPHVDTTAAHRFAPVMPRLTLTTPVPLDVPHFQPQPTPPHAGMHPHTYLGPDGRLHKPAEREEPRSSSSSSEETRKIAAASQPHALSSSEGQPPSLSTSAARSHPQYQKVIHPSFATAPDNYIPATGPDGSVELPPPHELGGRVSRGPFESAAPDHQHSSASSDKSKEGPVANPERERERAAIRINSHGAGSGEVSGTPTPLNPSTFPPGSAISGYQSMGSGSSRARERKRGRMHVVNTTPPERPASRAGPVPHTMGVGLFDRVMIRIFG